MHRTRRRRSVGGPGGLLAGVVVLAAVVAGCAGTSDQQVEVRAVTTTPRRTTTTAPPDCAEMLPTEALAAQLLMTMVTSPGAAAEVLADGTVGGFGLKGNQSSDVGEEIAAAVADAPLPPLVAADEEGGTVQRLRLAAGTVPSAAELAEGTPEDAAATLGEHATAVRDLGVGMIFGPVADVGSGSGLGSRTFGDEAETVAGFVEAVVGAQRDAGVIPVVKHWPGIGGGDTDPHVALTELDAIETLRGSDLVPFQRAFAAGAPAVMVAHAEVPGLTAAGEPASLSRAAVTGELREREGFDGLVITDSLGMGAVVADHTQAEAAELAVAAGADIALLSGTDVVADAHARLVEAIETGRLPREQVVASVRRVLLAKGIDGGCLDAVAAYSAIARATSTTTVPGQVGTSGTVADRGINDSGTASTGSVTTVRPTTSRPTTSRPTTTR